MPQYDIQSPGANAGMAIQKYLLDQAARERQSRLDAQAQAHQQEQERLAREQAQRQAEMQAQTIKDAEQQRQIALMSAGGRGTAVPEALAGTDVGRMMSDAAAPAVTDIVTPETNPTKQQGIYPGIIASSAPSISNSASAPGRVSRGTVAEQTAAEKEANYRKAGEALRSVTDRKEAMRIVLPLVGAVEADNVVNAFMGPKDVVKPPTAEEDKAKAIEIRARDLAQKDGVTIPEGAPIPNKYWGPAYHDVSTQGVTTSFNLNTPVRDTARSDRSYAALSTQIESGYKPVSDQLDRMGRLTVSVNQETPQADALIAPELLTAMAGGMGSGLRMNESEIARIVGGRSAFENLKATLMHYNPDNKQALSVTPAQRTQIRALITEMQAKLLAKQEAYGQARQNLAGADTVDEQRKVANDLKDAVAKIDNPPHAVTSAPVVPSIKSSGIKSITEMK